MWWAGLYLARMRLACPSLNSQCQTGWQRPSFSFPGFLLLLLFFLFFRLYAASQSNWKKEKQ